jgi:hypothetical protein
VFVLVLVLVFVVRLCCLLVGNVCFICFDRKQMKTTRCLDVKTLKNTKIYKPSNSFDDIAHQHDYTNDSIFKANLI